MADCDRDGVTLLGYGPWGRNLARNFAALGALRAIVEPDAAARALASTDHPQVPLYASLEPALAAAGPARFAIATPAETHAALAERLIDAGADVFVEKPMALDPARGDALVQRAEAQQRILMVGHLLLYHPGARALVELVRSGALGRLLHVYSNRLNWGKVRREENILWSFAPHDVALLLHLAGERPTHAAAHGTASLHPTIADVTVSHLRFASGLAAHIHVSWLHPFKEQRLVVVGDRRVAVFEDTAPVGQKLVVYDHAIDWLGGVPVARTAPARPVPFGDAEPLREECAAFLEACRTRQPPLSDGRSGLAVLEVLAACQRSMEGGGAPVSLQPPRPAPPPYYAHPTAVIDAGAEIGAGARIWHFSHVMGSARIGARAVLGQSSFVGPGVVVGEGCKVQNNVSLYDGVQLEPDVFVGPSVVFTNVRHPRAHVERKDCFEPTVVERGASLGANATVRCGVRIGRYAVVGAGALILRDVPPHAIVAGHPARRIGWACSCGERLGLPGADLSPSRVVVCDRCGARWRLDDADAERLVAAEAAPPIAVTQAPAAR